MSYARTIYVLCLLGIHTYCQYDIARNKSADILENGSYASGFWFQLVVNASIVLFKPVFPLFMI